MGAFDRFVSWIYGRRIVPPSDHDVVAFQSLLELYVMGDKFCVEKLKNEVSDVLRSYIAVRLRQLGPGLVYFYGSTTKGDQIRRLMVQQLACDVVSRSKNYHGSQTSWEEFLRTHRELAYDAFYNLDQAHRKQIIEPNATSKCCYHSHQETPRCD